MPSVLCHAAAVSTSREPTTSTRGRLPDADAAEPAVASCSGRLDASSLEAAVAAVAAAAELQRPASTPARARLKGAFRIDRSAESVPLQAPAPASLVVEARGRQRVGLAAAKKVAVPKAGIVAVAAYRLVGRGVRRIGLVEWGCRGAENGLGVRRLVGGGCKDRWLDTVHLTLRFPLSFTSSCL